MKEKMSLINNLKKISPIRIWAYIFLINLLSDIIFASIFGTLWSTTKILGLFQDIEALFVDLLLMPSVFSFFIWSLTGKQMITQGLIKAQVIEKINEDNNFIDTKLFKFILNIFFIIVALSVSFLLFGTFWDLFPWRISRGWLFNNKINPISRIPMWFFTTLLLQHGLLNTFKTIKFLSFIINSTKLKLISDHPDKCRGLKVISDYSAQIGYFIASIGLSLSFYIFQEIQAQSLSNYVPLWIAIFLYIILAPILFFFPLSTAHKIMKKSKYNYLFKIANQLDKVTDNIIENIQDIELSLLEENMKKINLFKELYDNGKTYPIWPFDWNNLRKFMSVTILPILPGFISLFIENIITKLLP